jgi:hypothetical protein
MGIWNIIRFPSTPMIKAKLHSLARMEHMRTENVVQIVQCTHFIPMVHDVYFLKQD